MESEFDLERELGLEIGEKERESSIPEVRIESPFKRELEEDEIGRIAISDELSVSMVDSKIELYVPENRRDRVAVGEYVVIPCEYVKQKIFANIEKLSYRKRDAIDDMSEVHILVNADEIGEDEYIEVATLNPISMISDLGRPAEVRHIPKPNTIVRRVTSEDEVKTGLDLPEDGLFLGYVAVNGERIEVSGGLPIPYYLRNDPEKTGDPLIFTHVLIAGMSGRGKTHVAKNFLRQIVGSRYVCERRGGEERKPNMIIIDPDNEYWQMMEEGLVLKGLPQEELDVLIAQGIKLGGMKSLTVFAAKEGEKRYSGADRYTEFTIPFKLVNDFPYLIAGGGLNEEQFDALVILVRDFFNQNKGEAYADFKRFVNSDEAFEFYKERGRIHQETFKAIRRRVLKPYFAGIFDQGANSITDIYEEIFDEDVVSVFPTDHLSGEGERVVILTIMSMVADAKTRAVDTDWGKRIARFPVILAVDEAHNYLTNAETQQDRIIAEKFVNAAKQGRKNRLGLVLITQNPQDVSEAVLSQVSTRVLLGMEQKMAEKAGAPQQYQKALPYFEKGRMIVHSPDNSYPSEISGLEFCVVRH